MSLTVTITRWNFFFLLVILSGLRREWSAPYSAHRDMDLFSAFSPPPQPPSGPSDAKRPRRAAAAAAAASPAPTAESASSSAASSSAAMRALDAGSTESLVFQRPCHSTVEETEAVVLGLWLLVRADRIAAARAAAAGLVDDDATRPLVAAMMRAVTTIHA